MKTTGTKRKATKPEPKPKPAPADKAPSIVSPEPWQFGIAARLIRGKVYAVAHYGEQYVTRSGNEKVILSKDGAQTWLEQHGLTTEEAGELLNEAQ